jgi:hypothetical protein
MAGVDLWSRAPVSGHAWFTCGVFRAVWGRATLGSNDSRGPQTRAYRCRALLHLTFVMSLNQRPFGTGEWYCKKQEILAHYLDTHTAESEDFLAFAHLIASDMGMSCSGDGAHDRIFQALATLRSFTRKGAAPKMMRRFSVNAL